MFENVNLTNGEVLHNIIPDVRDRINHMNDMVTLSTMHEMIQDNEGFNAAVDVIQNLTRKGENCITYLDAETNKLTTIAIEYANDRIEYWATVAEGGANYVARKTDRVASLFMQNGVLTKVGDLIFETADKLNTISITDIARNVVDQLSIYEIIDTISSSVLTNGRVIAADIMATVRNRITGVRGIAKNFLDTINSALTANNVSAVVSVIRQYLKAPAVTINSDGSWSFSGDYISKDWMATTILSGLANVAMTVGMVLMTVSRVAGLIVTGIGALTSGIVNVITQAASTGSSATVETTEGRELAFPLIRGTVRKPYVMYDKYFSLMNNKGPIHVELGSLSGYMWNEDPDNFDLENSDQALYCEIYPSTRACPRISDITTFMNQHFHRSVGFDDPTPGPLWSFHATVQDAYSFEDLLEWYRMYAQPIDWENMTDDQRTDQASTCMYAAYCFITLLLYANTPVGTRVLEIDDMPCINGRPLSSSSLTWMEWVKRFSLYDWGVGAHDDPNYESTYGLPGREIDWNYLTSGMRNHAYHENDEVCQFFGNVFRGAQDYFDQLTRNVGDYTHMFLVPPTYYVQVRYPLHVLPPYFDRNRFIVGAILTAAITVAAIVTTIVVAVKVRKWRQTQALKTQAATESAWNAYTANPTAENAAAYRKACLKQNTLGKLFGCSSVSNSNYWGGGGDAGAPIDKYDEILHRIG